MHRSISGCPSWTSSNVTAHSPFHDGSFMYRYLCREKARGHRDILEERRKRKRKLGMIYESINVSKESIFVTM